jgi:hypothetical protein
MNRWTRIVAVLGAVSLIAAGCGTAGENPLAPDAGVSRNSGGGFGTGSNDTGGDSPTTQTTSTDPVQSDSTSRGGGFATGSN